MKNVPMMKPATAAESVEIVTILTMVFTVFLNALSYLTSHEVASKTTLAAVKPKKTAAAGLNMKLMTVAMRPTAVVDPSFLVHHTVSARTEKPIISHRIGRPNIWKKIGLKIEFNTPQSEAQIAIAAMSRVSKWDILDPRVTR